MQSKTSLRIFQLVAGFMSLYHLVLGIIGTVGSKEFIQSTIYKVYGASPLVDAQFLYLAKFISIYMIAFSITMAFLAWNPNKYRKLIIVPILLISVRIIERLVFFDLLQEGMKTDMTRNLQVIVPITILLILLVIFRPKKTPVS